MKKSSASNTIKKLIWLTTWIRCRSIRLRKDQAGPLPGVGPEGADRGQVGLRRPTAPDRGAESDQELRGAAEERQMRRSSEPGGTDGGLSGRGLDADRIIDELEEESATEEGRGRHQAVRAPSPPTTDIRTSSEISTTRAIQGRPRTSGPQQRNLFKNQICKGEENEDYSLVKPVTFGFALRRVGGGDAARR